MVRGRLILGTLGPARCVEPLDSGPRFPGGAERKRHRGGSRAEEAHDRDGYVAKARPAFEEMGYGLDSLHEAFDPRRAVEKAEVIFCAGGNTFRLLKSLGEMGALPLIRRRVAEGMVYSGASAGSNLACPHYVVPAPDSTHMGETRETRIREFHDETRPRS